MLTHDNIGLLTNPLLVSALKTIFRKGVNAGTLSSSCLAHVSFPVLVNEGKRKHVSEVLDFSHFIHSVFSSLADLWEWALTPVEASTF